MRLLLDEMVAAVVAEQLRDRGYDVVAVQDPARNHLRGLDDCLLLAAADDERRAVVADNIPDFFRCHQSRVDDGLSHHGLLFFTNDSFPRHRHDLFVGRLIAALERELMVHEKDDPNGWIRWLAAVP